MNYNKKHFIYLLLLLAFQISARNGDISKLNKPSKNIVKTGFAYLKSPKIQFISVLVILIVIYKYHKRNSNKILLKH